MRDISLYQSTIPDYNHLLQGKKVLITTAARGIGKSIALLFAQQGATIYFGGRNQDYVTATEKELQEICPDCHGYLGADASCLPKPHPCALLLFRCRH